MSNDSVFCCNNGATCSNYKQSDLIGFEYVEFAKGFIWRDWKTSGISWVFLLSGKVVVTVGNIEIVAEAGEMFLLPPLKGCLKATTAVGFLYFVSDRPTEYCLNLVAGLDSLAETGRMLERLAFTPLIQEFLDLLLCYLQDGINCSYLFEEKQEELFVLMDSEYTKEQLFSFFYTLSLHKDTDFKRMIENNCLHVKSVVELAQLCGYSVSSFKRIFRKIFDESVYQWVLQKKADALKERLSLNEVNLKEIIYEFGFSSPAHFTKFCKQWLGMTPTKFIEEQKTVRGHIDL